jgi:hypothetical protein
VIILLHKNQHMFMNEKKCCTRHIRNSMTPEETLPEIAWLVADLV